MHELVYRFGNFVIRKDIDNIGSIPTHVYIENEKLSEIEIIYDEKGNHDILNVKNFCSSSEKRISRFAEELQSALELIKILRISRL